MGSKSHRTTGAASSETQMRRKSETVDREKDAAPADPKGTTERRPEKNKSKKKKKKKERKSRTRSESDGSNPVPPQSYTSDGGGDDDSNKSSTAVETGDPTATASRKERSRQKRKAKKDIIDALPKTDKDGIAYTKLQLRRMAKRVKNGLSPIPTEQELQEMKRHEAQVQKEEQELFYSLETPAASRDEHQHDETANAETGDNEDTLDSGNDDNHGSDRKRKHCDGDSVGEDAGKEGDGTVRSGKADTSPTKRQKKKARSKPVPDDYVCRACNNERAPRHWIYDCPEKITVRGRNQVAKKLRGLHDPDSTKVFVSGLPFDADAKDVIALFRNKDDPSADCGPVRSCKLVTYPDSGKSKGIAYLAFESVEAARKALKLSGTSIPASAKQNDGKKAKKGRDRDNKRKSLTLKVAKMKNRRDSKGVSTE